MKSDNSLSGISRRGLISGLALLPALSALSLSAIARSQTTQDGSLGSWNEGPAKQAMSQPGPAGWIMPLVPFHFTLVQNIKRDPFEQAVGIDQKTAMSIGGALGGPLTAFQYDWNMLPIGQQLWLEHLTSYEKFPPLQAPESYNLSQILEQVKKANTSASD